MVVAYGRCYCMSVCLGYVEMSEDEYLVCWSCDEAVSVSSIICNDGFCPCCNQEIELETLDEIRANKPEGATHYYIGSCGILNYAIIRRGRVYRMPKGVFMQFNEGWLKYFRYKLIAL